MEESLAIWRELEDKWWISFALFQLGWVDLYERDLDAAGARFEECISLARGLDNDFLLGRGLQSLGGVLRRTHNASAIPVFEEGLSIAQRSKDKRMVIGQLYHLGIAESARGNIVGASKRYEEAMALARELGDRSAIAEILARLAVDVVLPQGEVDRAEALIREGLELSIALGMDVEIAFDLAWLGYVATARQQFHTSAVLFSASESLFEKLGLSMSVWPDRARIYSQYVARTRTQLDKAAFAKAWTEGGAMTLEQAVDFALEGT
jgi:tetratricopeptide (TPR) repeat protein